MTEDRSKKSSALVENTIDAMSPEAAVENAGNKITAEDEAEVIIIVPFAKFLPLISEIGNIINEVIEIIQVAEHNRRTCHFLLQRVSSANLAVFNLKINHQHNRKFFNSKNYLYLQNLVNVIILIKKFIIEISQMKTLLKYIQAKSIERTFKESCKEFDRCTDALTLTITDKSSDGLEQLRADQEDLNTVSFNDLNFALNV